MVFIFLIAFTLFNTLYAVNTKHLVRHNIKNHIIQESHACRIIKQRKYENSVQCAKSKQPCKRLYIPESKNCR